MMNNKRGVSDVVATVLILLLTVAAVGVIAQFIVPFVKNSLEGSTECLDFQNYFTFQEKFVNSTSSVSYNCYDINSKHGASIRANTIKNESISSLAGLNIVFTSIAGTSKVVEIKPGQAPGNGPGGVYMLGRPTASLNIPRSGEVISYVYNAASGEIYSKAEIYAILNSGKICDVSDSIQLKPCEAGAGLG